jgi:hypothetical protein
MLIFKRITDLGKNSENDSGTNTAIAFTNWISVIVLFSSLGCTWLSYSLSPTLVALSWFFTLFNASSLLLTGLGYFTLARYVLNLGPSLYLALLHIAIKQPDQKLITAVLLIQIGVLSIPWIMFKASELAKLYSINGINILFILGSVYLSGQNNGEFDNSVYTAGIGVDFGLWVCVLGSVLIISFVNWTNHKGQQEVHLLLSEMEHKNSQMQQDQLQLKEYIQKVEEAQEIEKKRQWVSQGVTTFTEMLRTQRNSEALYDKLISTVVKTLEANQGAFYLVSDTSDSPVIELKACYAYNRKKWIDKQLEPGEGLVGQCYLEKEMLYLTDVPQGYTYITSGLGDATPTSLLLVPLISEERVEGILEIASFVALPEHKLTYIETISSIFGSHLFNEKMVKRHLHSQADF